MKKILIVNNNMHIGGVQKALISLLWSIRERYDVTLLLFYESGQLLKDIPPEVTVIAPDSGYRYLGITKYDSCSFKDKLLRSFYAGITRVLGRKHAVTLMALGQKRLEGYDVAISYLHNGGGKMFYGGCNDFVLKHVSARKKVTFLHCDYQLCGADTPENGKQYAKFDTIAACSQGCADAFLQRNPAMAEKVLVVPNCHRFEKIRADAEAFPVEMDSEKINIVTVARLGKEKGVERALRAIARLGALKEKMHYYIVGDGLQKPVLQQIIREENLSGCVTLCGMLSNPYGYIRSADLLLIPSYSEAAPLVIGEAASLGTPILTTETSSAREMVESQNSGWVCENSEDGLTEGLSALLYEPSRLKEKSAILAPRVFNNTQAVNQFEKAMT